MKKLLTVASIIGALSGTVNAAPITSPIFMPEVGENVSNVKFGYTTRTTEDKIAYGILTGAGIDMTNPTKPSSDKAYKAMNIVLDGQIGLAERLALNYGFGYDFARKSFDESDSGGFVNYYIGVTGRVVDEGINKLDIILNLGEEDDSVISIFSRSYFDLAVRYGLEINGIYNLAFSINGKYVNNAEEVGLEKVESGFNFGFTLENEFIIGEMFTIGLDLSYDLNDDMKLNKDWANDHLPAIAGGPRGYTFDSYGVFGFNIDGNYAINQENFVGIYFGMDFSDIEIKPEMTLVSMKFEPVTYKFGLKYTSLF